MPIQTIALPHYSVNCYLIQNDDGFVLIDTGAREDRAALENALRDAGCGAHQLKLVLVTHADLDHTGNCAYLQSHYRAPIALHHNEAQVVRPHGSMRLNRASGNPLQNFALSFFRLKPEDCFTPNRLIDEGSDLSPYHFDAQVLFLPGHSCGSIGILTGAGALFCGDLLTNTKRPEINSLMDDKWRAHASLVKLQRLNIQTVYPGHGQPFAWRELDFAA